MKRGDQSPMQMNSEQFIDTPRSRRRAQFPEVWVMQSDFQQVQNEKVNRRAIFQWENLTKHCHNQVIKL